MTDVTEALDGNPPQLEPAYVAATGALALHIATLSFLVDDGLSLDAACDRIDAISRTLPCFQDPGVQDYLDAAKALLRATAPKRFQKGVDHG